jgi:hypothetical protein
VDSMTCFAGMDVSNAKVDSLVPYFSCFCIISVCVFCLFCYME